MATISVAVMHHPRRADLLARLLEDLGEPVTVATDPRPHEERNPWRSGRLAWAAADPEADWHIVLQDDVYPCVGFLDAARVALDHAPRGHISFFVGVHYPNSQRIRRAAEHDERWVPLDRCSWYPTVASALPADLALELSAFRPQQRSDDQTVAQWANQNKVRAWATAPSLVQHDADVRSIGGARAQTRRRWAACFIGDCDPATIDWSH